MAQFPDAVIDAAIQKAKELETLGSKDAFDGALVVVCVSLYFFFLICFCFLPSPSHIHPSTPQNNTPATGIPAAANKRARVDHDASKQQQQLSEPAKALLAQPAYQSEGAKGACLCSWVLGLVYQKREKVGRRGRVVNSNARLWSHTTVCTHHLTHTQRRQAQSRTPPPCTYTICITEPLPFPHKPPNTQLNTAAVRQTADDFLQLDLDSLPAPDAQTALKQLDAAARARLAEAAQ